MKGVDLHFRQMHGQERDGRLHLHFLHVADDARGIAADEDAIGNELGQEIDERRRVKILVRLLDKSDEEITRFVLQVFSDSRGELCDGLAPILFPREA